MSARNACQWRQMRYIANMFDMRVRLPELLEKSGVSAYRLSKASGERIHIATVYRLLKRDGQVRFLDTRMLDAICDVLKVEPSELLSRDKPPAKKPSSRKRKRAA